MNKISQTTIEITNDHGEAHTYVFESEAQDAINAALAINRPLLIRGEPGVGKSQLAKAAAVVLGRTYIPFVVSANTEAKDLQWSFDAVARLADAQIEGALCKTAEQREESRKTLALKRYIKPAALWAALNWKTAEEQYKQTNNPNDQTLNNYLNSDKAKTNGVVVLIDEIDKADSSVTNGLLEVLGSNRFHPDGLEEPVEVDKKAIKPLIIITTNEERTLPDAFIRRCLSVTLGLPESRQEQIEYLVKHAEPNFKELAKMIVDEETGQNLLAATAEMIIEDRQIASEKNWYPLPGQAEFFDLLRGLENAREEGVTSQKLIEVMESLSRFTSKKVHQSRSKSL
jgi:MoxR-like ATPase